MAEKEHVYLVGYKGPEEYVVRKVHKTKEGALKTFHEVREELIIHWKALIGENMTPEEEKWLLENIEKLKEKDPEKIDVYPHETPFIDKMELHK